MEILIKDMNTRFIVRCQITKHIKNNYKVKISKRFLDEVEKYCEEKLDKIVSLSVTNCKKEKRKTLLKRDLIEVKNQKTLI